MIFKTHIGDFYRALLELKGIVVAVFGLGGNNCYKRNKSNEKNTWNEKEQIYKMQ